MSNFNMWYVPKLTDMPKYLVFSTIYFESGNEPVVKLITDPGPFAYETTIWFKNKIMLIFFLAER